MVGNPCDGAELPQQASRSQPFQPQATYRLALSKRRAPGAQPRRGLEGGADAKHHAFIEGAADDLHR